MQRLFKRLDQKIRSWNHSRIDLMRAAQLFFFKVIFDSISRFVDKQNCGSRVLIFRLDDKIGDSITSTGFLREIKKHDPTLNLIVLAGEGTLFVYQNLPFVDEIKIVPKNFFGLLKTFWQLNKHSYKYIVNTSHILKPRVIFLASCLKSYKKISFLNPNYHLFSDHCLYSENNDHVTKRYQSALKIMEIDSSNLHYEVVIPRSNLSKAIECTSSIKKINKKIIVLNSFAGARLRNLNEQTTVSLIQQIFMNNKNCVIISIAHAGDMKILKIWQKKWSHPDWLIFENMTTLMDNTALMSQADLIVTPDTSIVHLASALNKKLIAIFREDQGQEKNSMIWAPIGDHAKVIYAENLNSEHPDINQVNIQKVVESINIALKED